MKRNIISITFALLAAVSIISCGKQDDIIIPPAPDSGTVPEQPYEPEWEIVFEEDFEGTEIDSGTWNLYNSTGHNNHGLRHPVAFAQNGDGYLTVTAKMYPVNSADGTVVIDGETVEIPDGALLSDDGNSILVSGGMAHKTDFGPGTRFEFRAKCEKDPSNTTSAVILTWPEDGADRKSRCEESDIYETGSSGASTRSEISSFFHYGKHPDENGGKVTQISRTYEVDATEWHTMDYRWLKDKVEIYLDGNIVWEFSDPQVVPIYDHHICIQLDAFGNAIGEEPVRMYVDYVKIWRDTAGDKQ